MAVGAVVTLPRITRRLVVIVSLARAVMAIEPKIQPTVGMPIFGRMSMFDFHGKRGAQAIRKPNGDQQGDLEEFPHEWMECVAQNVTAV